MALYGMTRNQSSGLGRYAGGDSATQDFSRLSSGSTPTGFEASQTGGGQSGGGRDGGDWGNWSGSRSPQTKRDTSPQWSQPNVSASSIYARRPNQAAGPSLPDPKIDYDQRVQFNTPQQRMNVTGYGQGSAAQGAYAAPAPPVQPAPPPSQPAPPPGGYSQPVPMYANVNPGPISPAPSPSVVPGVKSGPDEFGGAPAQTPSVQFNTPWQRLGVSGYGAGNAAQGAFSEQTGQAGAPAPPSAPASPVGLSYQPLPQWANVNPGPIASPTVQFSTPVQRLGIDPFASQTASPRASMIPTPADIERARQLAMASPTGQPGSPFDRAVAAGTPGAIPVQSSYGGMFARPQVMRTRL